MTWQPSIPPIGLRQPVQSSTISLAISLAVSLAVSYAIHPAVQPAVEITITFRMTIAIPIAARRQQDECYAHVVFHAIEKEEDSKE